MHPVPINWLAFAAAVAARVVIGMIWYSPLLFGRAFSALTGRSSQEIQAGLPLSIASDIIGAAVMAFILAHAVYYAGAQTWLYGAVVGLFNWLGFVVVTQVALVMYEKRPMRLFLINVAQWGLVLAVMGAIFAGWR